MAEFSLVNNILSMLLEWGCVIYFYHSIRKKEDNRFRFLGFISLCFLVLIYTSILPGLSVTHMFSAGNLAHQILRTLINWGAVFGYLFFTTDRNYKVCSYLSALYILIYMTVFNLREALALTIPAHQDGQKEWIMLAVIMIIEPVITILFRKMVDIDGIRHIRITRWTTILIAIMIELYFKWSIVSPDEHFVQRPLDTVFYSVCATLGVLMLVIMMERNIAANKKSTELQMEQLRLQYENQNAKRTLRANEDIRRLYHDMKNHLLAIQTMMGSGTQANEYVQNLCDRLGEYEFNVHTGSPIVDGLLAEKMQRARLYNISFNVCMNLEPLSFITPVDMMTIFGNAVDNAVEALMNLPEGQERIVYLKTGQYANMQIIRISNQFAGNLSKEDGVLHTTKDDSQMHGIGLFSIKEAVGNYNGNVETEFENEDGWFRLMVMIPDVQLRQ